VAGVALTAGDDEAAGCDPLWAGLAAVGFGFADPLAADDGPATRLAPSASVIAVPDTSAFMWYDATLAATGSGRCGCA
jgi:hypothetical protein